MQREIIETTLGGRDTFALLPTGGGKSLCFQLPALMGEGLTLVVSPLIALMKDQVSQLEAAGVEATFLNSSLGVKETKARLADLHQGLYRLLYAAPERLMLDHWKENLLAWNVRRIAIDEAHCISEWGHDFRPEYRRIASLRGLLPDIPVMALTATATGRSAGNRQQQRNARLCNISKDSSAYYCKVGRNDSQRRSQDKLKSYATRT